MVTQNIVVVGTGEYGIQLLGPTLHILQQEGRVHVTATVDVKDRVETPHYAHVGHRLRQPEQDLSDLLSDLQETKPVVILGHSNEFHTPDALDLIAHGYSVMVEKPFAVSLPQLQALNTGMQQHPNSVALVEYYLMMKAAPVLVASGSIDPLSFYHEKPGIIETRGALAGQGWGNIHGKLEEMIGKPLAVYLDILEGEKKERGTGRVDHRGSHLIDRRIGGGMLQDLGVHGLTILFALEKQLGAIDSHFSDGVVRVARAAEYSTFARDVHQIPNDCIGESYAELDFSTASGVPVSLRVGKYVLDNRNQRRLVIVGDQGTLHHDLSTCQLSIVQGDTSRVVLLEAPKTAASKYYPVIRAGLEILQGNTLYHGFDATTVALRSQELVLFALDKAYGLGERLYSGASTNPKAIFS